MAHAKGNLSKILVDCNKISPEDLYKAIALQKEKGKGLKDVLITEGFIKEDDLLVTLSTYLHIPYLDPSKYEISPDLIKLVPENLVKKYSFFPLYKKGDYLLGAVSEPLDIMSLDNLRIALGCDLKEVLARTNTIQACIETYYFKGQSLPDILKYEEGMEIVKMGQGDREAPRDASGDLIQESQKEPVVRAVDLIINEALTKRASDIHIEPTAEDLTIRYRIDGILHKMYSLPRKIHRGICARIKILSNLDITKFYLPQDGRFQVAAFKRQVDFRVSSLPTIFGEKFVLRILEKAGGMTNLSDLGFSEHPLGLLREAIPKDHGIILITGPTGSGKSTTLNAILVELNTTKRHIVTIEDPVEYHIDGIGQTQIKPEINLSFASALRGILRQSPDIIMIGEIRDTETADTAIKAALIGQLIFSTLHTNDAVSAFARLIDMGVERYLVASSAILICAQRLCRRICPSCKEPMDSVPQYALQDLGVATDKGMQFFRGRGCADCYQTGYKGRVALLEAIRVDDYIRGMVMQEVSFDQIKDIAVKEGRIVPLRRDGLSKAQKGITTIEEVYRVTAKD